MVFLPWVGGGGLDCYLAFIRPLFDLFVKISYLGSIRFLWKINQNKGKGLVLLMINVRARITYYRQEYELK